MPEKKMVGFEIRTVNNLIRRYVESTLSKSVDCSSAVHGWAIRYFYVNRGKDVFQRDFELRFSIRRSTATDILKNMEKNGLIVREPVSYDARLKKISLTSKGVAIYKEIQKTIENCESKLSDNMTDEELKTFFSILDKIKANLEAKNDKEII